MLTIMASLAQQKSKSLSQNVKLGLQYRYQQGKVQVCTNRFLGYDKDAEGKLIVNKEEAEVVKRIYREYLEGRSYYDIGKRLAADGIKTAAGKGYWLATTLRKILSNEKYIGDALLQKTVTVDCLSKKRVKNNGLAPQYYVEGNHGAIIPKELFMRVQSEMARRAKLESSTGKRRVYSGKFALSNIINCSHCGEVYQRTHWYLHGEKVIVWRCLSRIHKKTAEIECHSRTLKETDLQCAVVKAINEVYGRQDDFLPKLKANIEKVLKNANSATIAEIDVRIAELEKQITARIKAHQSCDNLGEGVVKLREEKYKLQFEDANKEIDRQRLTELENFFAEQTELLRNMTKVWCEGSSSPSQSMMITLW